MQRRSSPQQSKKHIFPLRRIILLVLIIIAAAVFVPQLHTFTASFASIQKANLGWLIVGQGVFMLTAISAATVYYLLIQKPIRYTRVVSVQFAGMFVNRLLPAGIGGLGLFADFLYRQGHKIAQASGIVLLNNAIGLGAHAFLIILFALLFGLGLPALDIPHTSTLLVIAGVVAVLAIAYLVILRWQRARIQRFTAELFKTLGRYNKHKLRVLLAFAAAATTTLLHVVTLWVVFQAFGIDLSLGAALLVHTGGVAVGTATPTPGGVLGAEAGITAALVAYGIDPATALAAAITYRLLSYWLPLLPGVMAFWYVQKRKYI